MITQGNDRSLLFRVRHHVEKARRWALQPEEYKAMTNQVEFRKFSRKISGGKELLASKDLVALMSAMTF